LAPGTQKYINAITLFTSIKHVFLFADRKHEASVVPNLKHLLKKWINPLIFMLFFIDSKRLLFNSLARFSLSRKTERLKAVVGAVFEG